MNLREALINQNPSLELLRAAQAEIARLDAEVAQARRLHYEAQAMLARILTIVQAARATEEVRRDARDGTDYSILFDRVEDIHLIIQGGK